MARMKLTPTEARLFGLLKDGRPYGRALLTTCLDDDLAERVTLRVHLHFLRKKLQQHGRDIVCEMRGRSVSYRLVRCVGT